MKRPNFVDFLCAGLFVLAVFALLAGYAIMLYGGYLLCTSSDAPRAVLIIWAGAGIGSVFSLCHKVLLWLASGAPLEFDSCICSNCKEKFSHYPGYSVCAGRPKDTAIGRFCSWECVAAFASRRQTPLTSAERWASHDAKEKEL